ncbi:protein O-mannosyl-transferase TMTC2 [Ixodes scapularis]
MSCASRAIRSNQDLLPSSPLASLFRNDFWGTPLTHSGSHKSYRPLCVLSFRLNYLLGGYEPRGYHLLNVLLHAVASALFTALASRLFLRQWRPTLLAGLLFASHPVHTEAVAGIVGRADVGACLFFLAALLSYMQYCKYRDKDPGDASFQRRWVLLYLSLALAGCSMLTKEHGITVLAVCAVYDVFINHKVAPRDLPSLLVSKRHPGLWEGLLHLCFAGVTLVGLRLHLMGARAPDFAPADNPAADSESVLTRSLTFLYLPVFNLWLLLCPRWLSFDWSMEAIPLVQSPTDPRNLATAAFYATLFQLMSHLVRLANWRRAALPCSCAFPQKPQPPPSLLALSNGARPGAIGKRLYNINNNNNNNNGSSNGANGYHNGTSFLASPWNCGACSSSSSSASSASSECSESSCAVGGSLSNQHLDATVLALAMLVLPFVPATNLFFYVGFVVAERVLYVPSMGFCLLVAVGADQLCAGARRRAQGDSALRRLVLAACVALLLLLSLRTVRRNRDWLTEEDLYRSGIDVNPPKSYGNLANILSAHGKKAEAEWAYKKALTYRSNMADVHYNLGILLQEQNRLEEALQSYKLAIQFRPRLAMAHLNMGLVLGIMGRKDEAVDVYRHCAQLDSAGLKDPKTHESTKISALFNLGRLYADEGKYKEAIRVYQEAVAKMPDHYQPQSLYNMMGEAYFKLGEYTEAERWYKEALRAKNDHIPAHLTYAKLLSKWNRPSEAEQWFLRAKGLAPNDSSVYQHYGQFLSESDRHTEAAELYLRAAELAPDEYEIIFNAANTLRQAGRNAEAEAFYYTAVKLRPREVTSHMNLGAMLHVNGKLLEAESSYLEALRLKPDDPITQNNLQKLRNLLAQRGLRSDGLVNKL